MLHKTGTACKSPAKRLDAKWGFGLALAISSAIGLAAPVHAATTIGIGGPGEQGTFPPYYELRGGGGLTFTIAQDVKWGQTVHFTMADVLAASFDGIMFGRVAWNKPWESATIAFGLGDFTKFEGTLVGSINDALVLRNFEARAALRPWSNPDYSPAQLYLSESSFGIFGEDGRIFYGKLIGVPEPQAWALMLAGFGLVGAIVRKRTKSRVEALTIRQRANGLWKTKIGAPSL